MSTTNNSILAIEQKHFTVELIYPAATGYFTALKSMPSEVALLGCAKEVLRYGVMGGSVKHLFYFFALEKGKDLSITFQQIRTFEPDKKGDEVVFKLTILGEDEGPFEEKFINYSANSATYKKHHDLGIQSDSILPYGYPMSECAPPANDCMLKYGYPVSANDCMVKYGYPVSANDCMVKYGYPVSANDCMVKYGYPVPTNDCMVKYGYPVPTNDCIVKYGYPVPTNDCMVKYGYPVPTNDCIVKYGYPVTDYGFPMGECASTPNDCIVKYGYVPNLKYGYPECGC